MTPRILILSASVGAGHVRAAEALELALLELAPEAQVCSVDVLELTNPAFRQVYGKAYLDLVSRAPHLLGYFYDLMDRPRSQQRRFDRLRAMVERMNLNRFMRMVHSQKWDVIVNTHFLSAELIAAEKKNGRIAAANMTATTDFETHRLWVNEPSEHYFTATAEGAHYLNYWGVPKDNVTVFGIPIHPLFSRPKDRQECLDRNGLIGDRPIILQLAGGFGVGPIDMLHRSLREVERPSEIVVVAGRNEELQAKLHELGPCPRHRIKVLGFTKQIDELMLVADLVVTKPGGLTTSECLARGCAIVVVNPIPGQESRNSDFLLENGAAMKVNNIGTLAYKINALLADSGRLEALKQNALRIARPRAAFDIGQFVLDYATRARASKMAVRSTN